MADIDLDQLEVVNLVVQLVREKQQGFLHNESKQFFSNFLRHRVRIKMGQIWNSVVEDVSQVK